MVSGMEKFGEFVRRERKAKEIGLREMAKMIGVSPTYLSKIERDEFPPPAEDKDGARLDQPPPERRPAAVHDGGAHIAAGVRRADARVPVLVDGEEGVLGHVLGRCRATEDTKSEREHRAILLSVKDIEVDGLTHVPV